jgi:hypothetical protein
MDWHRWTKIALVDLVVTGVVTSMVTVESTSKIV